MKGKACPPHHVIIDREEFVEMRDGLAVYRWWGRCKKCRRQRSGKSVRLPDRE